MKFGQRAGFPTKRLRLKRRIFQGVISLAINSFLVIVVTYTGIDCSKFFLYSSSSCITYKDRCLRFYTMSFRYVDIILGTAHFIVFLDLYCGMFYMIYSFDYLRRFCQNPLGFTWIFWNMKKYVNMLSISLVDYYMRKTNVPISTWAESAVVPTVNDQTWRSCIAVTPSIFSSLSLISSKSIPFGVPEEISLS